MVVFGVFLLAIGIFCAAFYAKAVHRSVAELRTWSMVTSFLLIPWALMLLVLMMDALASLHLVKRKRGGGRKWPCWLAMLAVVLLFLGQPVLEATRHHMVPEQVSQVYLAASETWQPYRSSHILERTDCIATDTIDQGTMQLVYHDTFLHNAYLSAWQRECAEGQRLDTGSMAIAYQISPGCYTAAFPMEGELYILYMPRTQRKMPF